VNNGSVFKDLALGEFQEFVGVDSAHGEEGLDMPSQIKETRDTSQRGNKEEKKMEFLTSNL
jgi:hypothetical protein